MQELAIVFSQLVKAAQRAWSEGMGFFLRHEPQEYS